MNAAEKEAMNAVEEAITPLPLLQVCVLGMILVANSVSIWMIFTMLPFMIEFYFPEMSVKELGFRAGVLGSAFSLGALLGNLLWGLLADRIGRRPTLIAGLVGTGVASVLFGFAPSFWTAVLTRFLWGLVNGNIGLGKTYMGEILDDSNNAKGMALFSLFGGVGRTLGPALGGFLSSPAVKYPLVFRGSVFQNHPFALPCLIVSALCAIVVVLAFFHLPETLRVVSPSVMCCRASSLSSGAGGTAAGAAGAADAAGAGAAAASSLSSSSASSPKKVAPSSSVASPSVARRTANMGSYSRLETSDMDEQKDEPQQGLADSHGIEMQPSSPDTPTSPSGVPLSSSGAGGGGKKRVGFSNVVVVKVIGSESLAFGSLKRLSTEDVPVDGGAFATEREKGEEEEEMEEGNEGDCHGNHDGEDVGLCDDEEGGSGNGGKASSHLGSPRPLPLPQNRLRFSNGAELVKITSHNERFDEGSLVATVCYLLSRKEILLSTSLYGVNSFVQCVATEIFPLWVVTSVKDGGFGFDSSLIGVLVSISGLTIIVTNLFIYPWLVARIGLLRVYKLSCNMLAATLVLLPAVPLTRHLGSQALAWACLLILLALFNCTSQWVLTCVFTLINNSCYSHQRATVNGLGQTFASTGRLLAPYLGAILFAWTETNALAWPLNFAFTWYLVGFLAVCAGQLGRFFGRTIQRRKREPKVSRYSRSDL